MNKDLIITDDILIEQYNQNKLIDFVLHSNLFENVKEDSLNVKSLSNFVTFIQDKISNFMFVSFSDFLEYKKCANSVFFMRNILLYLQGKEYQAKPIVKEYLKKQEDIFIELQNNIVQVFLLGMVLLRYRIEFLDKNYISKISDTREFLVKNKLKILRNQKESTIWLGEFL